MSLLKRFYFWTSQRTLKAWGQAIRSGRVKLFLPAEARAKMVRLVPGLEPKQVLELMCSVDKNGFEKASICPYTRGNELSERYECALPFSMSLILAKRVSRRGPCPTTAGTGPMHTVLRPVFMAAFGIGKAISRDHGGDENVKIADYYTHIEQLELITSYE